MFIMYWGMLSFITPPVALSAFAAASVAQCSAMKVGIESMRLGTIIYFIPFFFVFNPAMLLQGSLADILPVVITAFIGVTLVSGALQGYLIGFGMLGVGLTGIIARIIIGVAGLVFAVPGGGLLGLSTIWLAVAAFILAGIGMAVAWPQREPNPVQV